MPTKNPSRALAEPAQMQEAAGQDQTFRLLFEQSPDAIFVEDLNGVVLDANPEACRLHGLEREQLVGRTLRDLIPSDAWEAAAKDFARLKAGEVDCVEGLSLRADGVAIPVEVRARPVRYEGREAMLLHVRNVRERKESQQALQRSQARLRMAVEASEAGYYEHTLSFSDGYVSPRWAELLGYTLEELPPIHQLRGWFILRLHPEEREDLLRAYRAFLEGKRRSFDISLRMRHRSGQWRWIRAHSRVVEHDDRGRPRLIAGLAFDVTDRIEAEENLRRANETLEARVRERTEELEQKNRRLEEEQAARARVEAALPETEKRFQTMADTAPVLIWVADLDKRCTYFNKTWLSFTGRTHEQEQGFGWAESVHPDDYDRCVSIYSSAFDIREPFTMEFRLRRHDGEYRWVLDKGTPRFDASGAFAGFIGSCIDITERRLAEEQVTQSEARFRALFNGTSDAIYVYHLEDGDRPGPFVEVNEVACKRMGYSREEFLAMTPHKIVDPGTLSLEHSISLLRREGQIVVESVHVAKDGRQIPVEVNAHLFDLNGRPTVISASRDITDRKWAEEERARLLERAQAAREEAEVSERRMAFLAEASAQLATSLEYEKTLRKVADFVVPTLADWCAVNVLNPEGQIEQVAVAHIDPEKVAWARTIGERYPMNPEAPQGTPNVLRTGRSEFYPEITDEHLVRSATDEEHLELLRQVGFKSALVVPMKAHGETLGTITFVWSETDRRYTHSDLKFAEELARRAGLEVTNARLYRAAQEGRERAEEMSQLKSAFLANMSHEIRTPLTGMIGFASLLATQAEGVQRQYAERIEGGGRRLLETLNAVLALSQLEANQAELQPEPLVVAREVEQVVALAEAQARQRGLDFIFDLGADAEDLRARLDRGALSGIVHNLVGNALKFTEEGSIRIRIEAEKERVVIHVEDTGIGIEQGFLPFLFEPFRQESRGWARTHEGAGLGLSITKRLVDRMGGEIHVWSEKGKGSRFTVSFPVVSDTTPQTESKKVETDMSSVPGDARILVVEDNTDTQFLIESLLADFGEVHLASNATEAMREAQEALEDKRRRLPFDLVLMDINLGHNESGTDVLRSMRAIDAYAEVPVAAVTAYALPGDRERLLELGFDAYLAKPFNAEELTALANRLLRRGDA